MTFCFDEIIPRRGTNCVKWDEEPANVNPQPANTTPQPGTTVPHDIIPLWVADMDFRVAPAIQRAIEHRASHPVFGYAMVPESYYDAVVDWFHRRHNWSIDRDQILYTTGVVPAVSCALQALTMPGERVLVFTPVYNCFFSSIRNSGCEILSCMLSYHDNTFTIDWHDFEEKCADEKTTVLLLCNPHNPAGRVWTADELAHINDICLRHNVKVVSDEIHCELIMPGNKFQPFAAVSDACRDNCVVLNSPSKSFNTAGLQIANIICSNAEWRRRINRAININEVCDVNPFAAPALIAAYNESEAWLDALCQYIWQNYQDLCDFFAREMPLFSVTRLEGTYLVWVDISALAVSSDHFCNQLLRECGVWLNPGTMYGQDGFVRINIACPNSLLMDALRRMAKAACTKACGQIADKPNNRTAD